MTVYVAAEGTGVHTSSGRIPPPLVGVNSSIGSAPVMTGSPAARAVVVVVVGGDTVVVVVSPSPARLVVVVESVPPLLEHAVTITDRRRARMGQ